MKGKTMTDKYEDTLNFINEVEAITNVRLEQLGVPTNDTPYKTIRKALTKAAAFDRIAKHLPELTALVEAGEKATQGEWAGWYEGSGDFAIVADGKERAYFTKEYSEDGEIVTVSGPDSRMFGGEQSENNYNFIKSAANTRPALEAIKKEIEDNG